MNELGQLQLQLVELQTQLAFQEDMVAALDRVVIAQQQRLEQLEQSSGRLERQLAHLMGLDGPTAAEVPPHY